MKHKSMYISIPPRALTYQSPTHNTIQPLLHLRITFHHNDFTSRKNGPALVKMHKKVVSKRLQFL